MRIETNEEGQVSSTLVIEHFTKDDVAEVSKLMVIFIKGLLHDRVKTSFHFSTNVLLRILLVKLKPLPS